MPRMTEVGFVAGNDLVCFEPDEMFNADIDDLLERTLRSNVLTALEGAL